MGELIQRKKLSVRAKRSYNVIYLLATVLLILGFSAQLSSQQFSGLILVTVGFFCLCMVNTYGLILSITGTKIELDFFISSLQIVGLLLSFFSIVSVGLAQSIAIICIGIAGSSLMFVGALLIVLISFKKQHNERVEAVSGPTSCLKGSLIVKE